MDDRDPSIFGGHEPQIDDPDIGQTGGYHQAREPLGIGQMAFVEMESPAFLVRKEGFDAEPLSIIVSDRISIIVRMSLPEGVSIL